MLSGYSAKSNKWGAANIALGWTLVVLYSLFPGAALAEEATAKSSAPDQGPSSVQAKPAAKVDPAIANNIIDSLKLGRAGLVFSGVESSHIPGVYKVQVERGPLLYVSEDGKYFIAGGELYGVVPGNFVNIQEQEFKPKRVELLAQVKSSDQIVFSPKGKTKAHVNVFTDVDCGFCRKLHLEVPAMNAKGIEIRYMAYPRAGLNSPSYDKIATAWCADNPQETLTRLKNRENVKVQVCEDNPIADQMALGVKVGVRGTPALVLADGSLLPGYVSADELAKMLGIE